MDIEILRDIAEQVRHNYEQGYAIGFNLDDHCHYELAYGLKSMLDAAIARQPATSEEVQEAINVLATTSEGHDVFAFYKSDKVKRAIKLAITALQQYQPWVSVSERSPGRGDADKGGYVLTRFSDRAIESWKWDEIASWNEDNNRSICKLAAITHWRPMLPEPPKGE